MTRLRTRELHRDGSLRIDVVESIHVEGTYTGSTLRLFARLQPVAIMVRDGDELTVWGSNRFSADLVDLRENAASD